MRQHNQMKTEIVHKLRTIHHEINMKSKPYQLNTAERLEKKSQNMEREKDKYIAI